jgi:hypothetical protein
MPAKSLLPLFDKVGLAANPRSSRRNSVVDDILNTLGTSAELFRYKSKGILIGTADYEPLQRKRFRLRFNDPDIEGILDGGHNMLAIGLHMLQPLMEEKEWKRLKYWDDMKDAWKKYRDSIDEAKDDYDFYVPVELLVPSGSTEDDRDAFLMPLLEVCEARNNNAQLTIEAKSNKQGFYDAIKNIMPEKFCARVEWKPNDWKDDTERRPIKVRDLVSLAWIPLNLLNEKGQLPFKISVSPQNTYRNKGECSKRFEELMSHDEVTGKKQGQGAQRVLNHVGVASAFKVLADLPELYDRIYQSFPKAYNNGGERRFAANPIVKIYDPDKRENAKSSGREGNYLATEPKTPFYRHGAEVSYPEGLIVPLIYGLQGLLVVENDEVRWAVDDPGAFVDKYLAQIAESYQMVIHMARWDPQKISKDQTSYDFAVREFRTVLRENSDLTLPISTKR